MDRIHWQRLAEERLLDAVALLGVGRWAAAYYLAGYAVECGLKACLLRRLQATPELIFSERNFSNSVFTHKLEVLVGAAGLDASLVAERNKRQAFGPNYAIACKWEEKSRYELKSEIDARGLVEAITVEPDGVMQWIRQHW